MPHFSVVFKILCTKFSRHRILSCQNMPTPIAPPPPPARYVQWGGVEWATSSARRPPPVTAHYMYGAREGRSRWGQESSLVARPCPSLSGGGGGGCRRDIPLLRVSPGALVGCGRGGGPPHKPHGQQCTVWYKPRWPCPLLMASLPAPPRRPWGPSRGLAGPGASANAGAALATATAARAAATAMAAAAGTARRGVRGGGGGGHALPGRGALVGVWGSGFCLMSVLPYPGGGVGGWVWQNFRVGGCPTTPPPRVGWDFVGALGLLSQCHFFLSSVAGSV